MTDDLVERLKDWPYQGETMAHEAADRIEALTALVREADDLIGGDLTGLQWKRECRSFRVKALAALKEQQP